MTTLQLYRNCILSAAVALMFCANSSAAVISIDFDQDALIHTYSGSAATDGLVPLGGQAGTWNRLVVGTSAVGALDVFNTAASTNTPSVSSLVDGGGVTTGVSYTFNTGSGNYGDFTISGAGLLGSDVAVLGSAGNAASIGWRFDGLLASSSYTIRIFGQTVPAADNFATFAVAGGIPASASTSAGTNYVDFTVTSDASGVITGTFVDALIGTENFSSMSGIQIDGNFSANTAPEPSTFVLVMLGTLSLGLLRRRRS